MLKDQEVAIQTAELFCGENLLSITGYDIQEKHIVVTIDTNKITQTQRKRIEKATDWNGPSWQRKVEGTIYGGSLVVSLKDKERERLELKGMTLEIRFPRWLTERIWVPEPEAEVNEPQE